jgi:hypothetical protein
MWCVTRTLGGQPELGQVVSDNNGTGSSFSQLLTCLLEHISLPPLLQTMIAVIAKWRSL